MLVAVAMAPPRVGDQGRGWVPCPVVSDMDYRRKRGPGFVASGDVERDICGLLGISSLSGWPAVHVYTSIQVLGRMVTMTEVLYQRADAIDPDEGRLGRDSHSFFRRARP